VYRRHHQLWPWPVQSGDSWIHSRLAIRSNCFSFSRADWSIRLPLLRCTGLADLRLVETPSGSILRWSKNCPVASNTWSTNRPPSPPAWLREMDHPHRWNEPAQHRVGTRRDICSYLGLRQLQNQPETAVAHVSISSNERSNCSNPVMSSLNSHLPKTLKVHLFFLLYRL